MTCILPRIIFSESIDRGHQVRIPSKGTEANLRPQGIQETSEAESGDNHEDDELDNHGT